jgi:hypothetical protein
MDRDGIDVLVITPSSGIWAECLRSVMAKRRANFGRPVRGRTDGGHGVHDNEVATSAAWKEWTGLQNASNGHPGSSRRMETVIDKIEKGRRDNREAKKRNAEGVKFFRFSSSPLESLGF